MNWETKLSAGKINCASVGLQLRKNPAKMLREDSRLELNVSRMWACEYVCGNLLRSE